jgi:hypothetical protein
MAASLGVRVASPLVQLRRRGETGDSLRGRKAVDTEFEGSTALKAAMRRHVEKT